MEEFSTWIEATYPDLYPDGVDRRLVTIASKAYKFFQSSSYNSYRA
jgi:hypothetical protein